jgi:regulator of cell morphogenesis and NO signaling
MISLSTKVADIINIYPFIINQLEYFEIYLPIGDYTIKNLAERENINPEFLIFLFEYSVYDKISTDYIPQIKDLNFILTYLKNNHKYYSANMFPHIDKLLQKANYDLNSDLKLVIKFFKEYYSEVIEHFDYENNIVFPYINFLLEKSENYNLSSNIHYSMEEYKNHHDDINEKLLDLKNLLIKYLPSTFDSVLRKKLLFNLYQLEKDLAIHSYIEDKILIPIVEMLENECK